MLIKKVVRIAGGFRVNDQFFVPEDETNEDYKLISAWQDFEDGKIEDEFSPSQLLQQARVKKTVEMKALRDAKNIETIVDTQAATIGEDGELTGQTSYFVFHTSRHPMNPAADPSGILTGALILNQTVPYSTKSPSGEKITVAITPEIARSLSAHIADRNNGNYRLSDAIETAIKAAETVAEVEAITWNTKYLV